MPPLADLQRDLAAALAGRGPGPAGMEPGTLERARRSLQSKRRRAAGHLLPRLRQALGSAWAGRFGEHAEGYTPAGLLYHVDDAWELAATLARDPDPGIAAAARDDLVALRLRWTRRPRRVDRIRERRGFHVALTRSPRRFLIVRLPGTPGKIWRLPI
ncbi:MAG TPA: hypothetical protein VIA62_16600 [Thermoanaerobaculia bacterium]|jgi:hypothetical protein|nr:hypothetical protein [Thermoanaerobaculia bacterium]